MKKHRIERKSSTELYFLRSLNGWNMVHYFWHASRKFAPTLCWDDIGYDVKIFDDDRTNINSLPKYVLKYLDMKRKIRQKRAANRIAGLSPRYKCVSPSRLHW